MFGRRKKDTVLPVFTMEELGRLTPDEMLERVRKVHRDNHQHRELHRLNKSVKRNGNPYIGKQIFPPKTTS